MTITDKQLQENILEELSFTPQVNSKNIGVSVRNGIITLTNAVSSWSEKIAINEAVKKICGVKGIANDLTIDLLSSNLRNDTDIAEAAVTQLKWSMLVPSSEIKVEVEKGMLTLTGTVNWDFQKRAAEERVEDIIGVKSVINQIKLKSNISSTGVKTSIERALERTAEIDAGKITVNVEGNEITLGGSVRSWIMRDEAEKAAWCASGVTAVNNNISVI